MVAVTGGAGPLREDATVARPGQPHRLTGIRREPANDDPPRRVPHDRDGAGLAGEPVDLPFAPAFEVALFDPAEIRAFAADERFSTLGLRREKDQAGNDPDNHHQEHVSHGRDAISFPRVCG